MRRGFVRLGPGRELLLEEAIVHALAEDEPANATARRNPALGHPTGGLAPHEREVVALVARGLSNREIAAQLVITERTAGAHVEHVLDKLGLALAHADRGLGRGARADRIRPELTHRALVYWETSQ